MRCWCGPAGRAMAVEDFVFGDLQILQCDLARLCHPVCDRGRRIQSRRAFRRAGMRIAVQRCKEQQEQQQEQQEQQQQQQGHPHPHPASTPNIQPLTTTIALKMTTVYTVLEFRGSKSAIFYMVLEFRGLKMRYFDFLQAFVGLMAPR